MPGTYRRLLLIILSITALTLYAQNKTRTNSIGMDFVKIPAGSFEMGSAEGEDDEQPVHTVVITGSLFLSRYEVTQAQWEAVMRDNPSEVRGPTVP